MLGALTMNPMLATAQSSIREAGRGLGFDEQIIERFLRADHEHIFEVCAGGRSYPAYRVQHSNKLGPYKGGIRFHPQVTLDEVRALAALMSVKTAAVGLDLGGGKGGVAVDPKVLTEAELEELSRDYARKLAPHIGSDRDIPAPDVNTNSKIIGWMLDEYEKTVGHRDTGCFTGKSLAEGGSEGREAATGRGGVIALVEYLRQHDRLDEPLTVALQGYGNVGYYFAKILHTERPNLKLIAIANSKQTWLRPDGIDPNTVTQPSVLTDAVVLDSAAITRVDADILVLAALEDAVSEENAASVRARIIVELANGPITAPGERTLLDAGMAVLPDVVANSGGVIVSCLEWRQNRKREHWSPAEVDDELRNILLSATRSVLNRSADNGVSYRRAAFELALRRLLT
jgi:glutamate dehydrogenase/leucine dehydrogenase